MNRNASSDVDPWREVDLDLSLSDGILTVSRTWRAGRYWQRDSLAIPVDGRIVEVPTRPGKWFDQVYEGVFIPEGAVRRVHARVKERGRLVHLTSEVPLETSQGVTRVVIDRYFRTSSDGLRLLVAETRSSRLDAPPMVYLYDRISTP